MQELRGSPENTGTHLTTVQSVNILQATPITWVWHLFYSPVIRTHPVTGFKSLFVNREYVVLCCQMEAILIANVQGSRSVSLSCPLRNLMTFWSSCSSTSRRTTISKFASCFQRTLAGYLTFLTCLRCGTVGSQMTSRSGIIGRRSIRQRKLLSGSSVLYTYNDWPK